MNNRFVFRPHVSIPNEWEVMCMFGGVYDPNGVSGYTPVPLTPPNPVACASKNVPTLGEVFLISRDTVLHRLSLFFFSARDEVLYNIVDYKESESYVSTREEVGTITTVSSAVVSGKSGRWTEMAVSESHSLPTNDTMDGYYWTYNACDIVGRYNGSEQPSQIVHNVGEGWRPCFFAGSTVQPESVNDIPDPNIVTGWVRTVSYAYKVMTLRGDFAGLTGRRPPGGLLPLLRGGIVGGMTGGIVGGTEDDDEDNKGGGDTVSNIVSNVRTNIRLNGVANYGG